MIEFQRIARQGRPVNLTPLIDVVFLLIVFFMLTTSFVKSESIEMAFPKGESTQAEQRSNVIVIVMVDSGRLYLTSKEYPEGSRNPVSRDVLSERLRGLMREQPDRSILLMSSELNTVQEVVDLMDVITLAGGKNLAVSNWKPRQTGVSDER